MSYQQQYEVEKHRADSFEKEIKRLLEFEAAIIDASVVNWTFKKEHENNPRLAIQDLITCCINEALDPVLNPSIIAPQELIELSKWLDSQYLPYDNESIHNVVRKIQRIVSEYELARQSGSPTQGS